MTGTTSEQRGRARVDAAFRRERSAALVPLTIARTVAILIIGIFLHQTGAFNESWYLPAFLAAFVMLGFLQLALDRLGLDSVWVKAVFMTVDFALLTYLLLAPSPLMAPTWPQQMNLRYGNFIFFFVLLAGMVLSYSRGLVAAAGLVIAVCWAAGTFVILSDPATLTWADFWPDGEPEVIRRPEVAQAALAHFLDPHMVDVDLRLQEIVVVLIVAGILAVGVHRARRLVRRQAMAERARGNLARYFSPNLVDALATADEPLGPVRSQTVAVLFADIVGFTRLSEGMAPPEVIALLRGFHGRMAQCVFAHAGTVDKYIGDAIMATFGTPRRGARDAVDALDCARTMVTALEAWNRERAAKGEPPIAAGIGVHYGEAVLGDIGTEQRLEYTAIGDTVNVASRLEALTRTLGVTILISGELAGAVCAQGGDHLLDGFTEEVPEVLRNRAESTTILAWRGEGAGG